MVQVVHLTSSGKGWTRRCDGDPVAWHIEAGLVTCQSWDAEALDQSGMLCACGTCRSQLPLLNPESLVLGASVSTVVSTTTCSAQILNSDPVSLRYTHVVSALSSISMLLHQRDATQEFAKERH